MTLLGQGLTESPYHAPTLSASVVAGVAARLRDEFDCRYSRQLVEDVIQGCLNDLSAVPTTALPELVERLARERLRSGRASRSAKRVGPA